MANLSVSNENLLAVLAYFIAGGGAIFGRYGLVPLLIVAVVFLLLAKKNDFVRFHAMQAILVFGALFLLQITFGIVPILHWLMTILISPVFNLVSFLLWIILMWKAFNGERFKLPYFGELAERYLEKLK